MALLGVSNGNIQGSNPPSQLSSYQNVKVEDLKAIMIKGESWFYLMEKGRVQRGRESEKWWVGLNEEVGKFWDALYCAKEEGEINAGGPLGSIQCGSTGGTFK